MFVTYEGDTIMTLAATKLDAIAAFVEEIGLAWEEALAYSDELHPVGVSECTAAFAAEVEEYGGVGRSWGTLPDGTICTVEEEELVNHDFGEPR